MSRSQSTSTYNTATGNSKTDQSNATNSYGDAQSDISDYQNDLSKFMSSNPYTKGGEYDQTINTGLANASDAGSSSLKASLQDQALRTGQNSAANAATAAEASRANTRDLANEDATAQQNRIQNEAAYNTTGLQAATEPISAESSLYGTSSGAANSALNTAEQAAANNKSFFDQLGGSFASGLGGSVGSIFGGK